MRRAASDRRSFIEGLESRTLLSAAPQDHTNPHAFDPGAYGPAVVVQSGTTLTIENAHDLQVRAFGGEVTVIDKSPGGLFQPEVVYTGVTNLVITGTRGDDTISAGVTNDISTTIYGGPGRNRYGKDTILLSNNDVGGNIVDAVYSNVPSLVQTSGNVTVIR